MTDPTPAMLVAGTRKLQLLRAWNPPDVVVVEAIWYEMEEARKRENISGSSACKNDTDYPFSVPDLAGGTP